MKSRRSMPSFISVLRLCCGMSRRNLEKRRHAIPDLGFHGLRSHINFLPQAEEWRLDQKVRSAANRNSVLGCHDRRSSGGVYIPRGSDNGPLMTGACAGGGSGAGIRFSKAGVCGTGGPLKAPRPCPPTSAKLGVDPRTQVSANSAAKRRCIVVFPCSVLPPVMAAV